MPLPRPLTKEMILDAMSKTRSNLAASRYLGVSYKHYKMWAKQYKDENGLVLFNKHKNPSGKGIPKFLSKKGVVGNILDVVEGRIPVEHFTPQKIRDKLIVEGYVKEECYRCKMHERRLSDNKQPLILNWRDNNRKNFNLTNLELVCYNCYFLYINDLFTEKQITHMEDYIPTPATQEIDWGNIDKSFDEHFRQLGFKDDKPPEPGSEYISRLK